jgi:hypothetical protein
MVSSENDNPSTSAPLLKCVFRNKYEKWYWETIERSPKTRPTIGKFEEHHIVPKCCGGHKTDPSNLCYPSPREHFILHRLLNKMYPDHEGLWYAIFRMSSKGRSRVYSHLKENYVRSALHNLKIKRALTNTPLSEDRKKNISRARLSSLNTLKGPNHPLARRDLWEREEEIRRVWLENGKPKWIRLGSLIGLDKRAKTLSTMVKKFEEEDIV